MDNNHKDDLLEEIAKQWPGFTVTCKCGSKQVSLEDSRGFSAQSGGWGSVDLKCNDCGHQTVLIDDDL